MSRTSLTHKKKDPLLKTKKDYEEAIAKFKFEAKQAMAILKKHKEAVLKKLYKKY